MNNWEQFVSLFSINKQQFSEEQLNLICILSGPMERFSNNQQNFIIQNLDFKREKLKLCLTKINTYI